MRTFLTLLALGPAVFSPAMAWADRCSDLAKPATFDEHTAMAAIFCEYDRAKGGTLLPVEYTKTWDMKRAEYLATPLLAATYVEAGIDKGVLVVQRQMIVENDVAWSHATSAVVSVYVFKRAGARWQFEKGAKEALDAGANGNAPGAELIKLGDDRFGLWFEGGDIHQGYTNSSAFIVTLSTDQVLEAGHFDLAQGNSGTCSDDPKERVDGVHKCWEYEARREFARVKGSPYYTLRLAYSGTDNPDPTDDEQIEPKNEPACFDFLDGEYAEMEDPSCKAYTTLTDREIAVGTAGRVKKTPAN